MLSTNVYHPSSCVLPPSPPVFQHLFFLQSIHADIKLPAIVSSNMVLQREANIVLWGWADAKENFTINASWLNSPINLEADKEGNWKIEVKTTNSKDSQTISILGKT